ncbi:MAG: sigma-70 family RNA polymerase sigma factor [Candidatus Paceibacterota bacterium]
MPLTPEQSQMVEDNIKLAYFALNKYRKQFEQLEPEDILSTCFIGLCRAARGYNPELGTAFSTYAMTAMYRQIILDLVRGRKQVEPIYLEEISLKKETTSWQDIIGSDDSTEDKIIYKMLGEQIMVELDNVRMNEKYKEIIRIHYREPDLSQSQVGKLVGRDHKTVCTAYRQAREKLRPMVCMG